MEDLTSKPLIPNHTNGTWSRDADRVYSKVGWRIIPPLFLMTAVCYVDRYNISLAAINMSEDLNISKTQYGTAASIFFATYVVFQIPSNVMLKKVGGPIWLGTILIGWGIVASLTAFVRNVWQLYLMRLLLGAFEAGTFPGAWYYTSAFYPQQRLPIVISIVNTGIKLGLCSSAPVAGGLLSMHGLSGLSGWQWLFVIEGIPPVLLGCFMMFYLPKSTNSGNFLSVDEQNILEADRGVSMDESTSYKVLLKDVVFNMVIWVNVLAWTLVGIGKYAAQYWTPTWIESMASGNGLDIGQKESESDGEEHTGAFVAFLTTIPYSFAALTTVLVGWSAGRLQDNKYHIVSLLTFGGIVIFLLPTISHWDNLPVSITALTLMHCAVSGISGIQVTLLLAHLTNESKSFGLGWANSLGNLSGLVGPQMVGSLVDKTGSYVVPLYVSGAVVILAAILFLTIKNHGKKH